MQALVNRFPALCKRWCSNRSMVGKYLGWSFFMLMDQSSISSGEKERKGVGPCICAGDFSECYSIQPRLQRQLLDAVEPERRICCLGDQLQIAHHFTKAHAALVGEDQSGK